MEVDATSGPARYALYWAPPEHSPLARLGAAWLGREAIGGNDLDPPPLAGWARQPLAALTADPRRYGLHATLKAPFALAAGCSAASLEEALASFAAGAAAVPIPSLQVRCLGGFLALVPSAPSASVNALADACLRHFDPWRAPPTAAELARRRAANLSPAQEENLRRWGYPHVMADYRFHVSLTRKLDAAVAARLLPQVAELFAPALTGEHVIGDLALFVEPTPGAPFLLRRRFALQGRSSETGADPER